MNNPDWHPISRYSLTWDRDVSSVDLPDVFLVSAVTGVVVTLSVLISLRCARVWKEIFKSPINYWFTTLRPVV